MDYEKKIAEEDKKWKEKIEGMSDYFAIYQLKIEDEYRGYHFMSTRFLHKLNLEVQKKDSYNILYASSLMELVKKENFNDIPDMLEFLFERFNIDRPSDFFGHSLSVSDVIVVNDGIEKKSYYVDDLGFTELVDWGSNC